MHYDVAIVGGGPGGSTCATFLRKFAPKLKVAVFERDVFPRDHIGESQLPVISYVLDEMGVWDKVEAAGFPVKIGATYRWGKSNDLWDFNFTPKGEFLDEARPAKFTGQRRRTAFQVDRAIYDKILLDHAKELGADVFENTKIASVGKQGRKIAYLKLENGEQVTADMYVDASGNVAALRRSLGVPVDEPSALKNIALYDYWQNAEWAVKLGIGGTRIQIMSLGYGWIWFIPLGPTRTSIGFVCPAEYYKSTGLKPEELYRKALAEEPRISQLIAKAESEGKFTTTKDWSFVSETMADENWMLVGEAAGFADPILSAGLTLTHASAREAAFTIIELKKGGDKEWLYEQYNGRNRRRIGQHIRFADYWYKANAHFDELKQFTTEIAKDAGMDLTPEKAFQWIGTGGFVDEDMYAGGLGSYSFFAIHEINRWFHDDKIQTAYGGFNAFELNLEGAEECDMPSYERGRVTREPGWSRDGKVLPMVGMVGRVVRAFQAEKMVFKALSVLAQGCRKDGLDFNADVISKAMETVEALVRDGWLVGSVLPGAEPLDGTVVEGSLFIHANRDSELPPERRAPNI